MSRSRRLDEPAEHAAAAPEQSDGGEHAPLRQRERLRVGEHLPAALTREELMELLGLRKSRFYVLQQQGVFDRWRLRPALGRRVYSGALVERWLKCEDGASRFALKLSKRSA